MERMATTDDDDLSRLQRPRFARLYLGVAEEADRRGGAEHRRRLLAGLGGTVVEVGAGHGPNFRYYPPEVTDVLAVEPDATLRAAAERAAAAAPVPVRVVAGHADALPAADASVANVVTSLVLCSVADPHRTLAEVRRVLVPGGTLRYYEHVRSAGAKGLVQDAVRPLWTRIAGGCHPNRRTGDVVRAAGFTVDTEDRFTWRPARLGPASDHLIGSAHRGG
jgi:SAM-dependent methyltransferase